MDLKEFYERGAEYFLPNLSIDMVIIGYRDHELKCLLLQIGDKWLLPGGHIAINESVIDAVKRILRGRTGLQETHMKFLSIFGDKNRQFSEEYKEFFEKSGLPWDKDYWLNNRFVTLSYYSLVNIENTHPIVGQFDEAFDWFNIDDLPNMWMDHKSIIKEARNRLKGDIMHEQVTYNLLANHFTMPELHQLHQTILEKKLDRSRFQKKMLSSGMFERLPKRQNESPGSNPYQYRLKSENP